VKISLSPLSSLEVLISATAFYEPLPSPCCHPERTRISYFAALTGATYVVLLKENHMQLFEAATLDRKSGEADLSRRAVEGSAVRHSGAPNLPFYNHFPFVIPPVPACRGTEA
jgi:hypothetical protein